MKRLILAALGLTFLFSTPASAFDPDIPAIENPTVIERFPAGTLVTREKAEQALSEVGKARRTMNELVDYSMRRCQENFFVNSCLEDVRKAKLRQDRRFLAIETEARQFIRKDDTAREAKRQARRDAKAASAPKKIKPAQPRANANKAAANAQKAREQRQKRAEQVKERQQQAAERKALEKANREAYEKKLKEREERRLEREKRLQARLKKKAEQNK